MFKITYILTLSNQSEYFCHQYHHHRIKHYETATIPLRLSILTVQKMFLKSKRSDHAVDRCWSAENKVKHEDIKWKQQNNTIKDTRPHIRTFSCSYYQPIFFCQVSSDNLTGFQLLIKRVNHSNALMVKHQDHFGVQYQEPSNDDD